MNYYVISTPRSRGRERLMLHTGTHPGIPDRYLSGGVIPVFNYPKVEE
jgi:hypothetical protein